MLTLMDYNADLEMARHWHILYNCLYNILSFNKGCLLSVILLYMVVLHINGKIFLPFMFRNGNTDKDM